MLSDSLTADANRSSVPPNRGHKPSNWTPHFEFNAIIEYSCSNCGNIVYYALWRALYCPHCGAPIHNFPRKKLDAPQLREMPYNDLEKMKYAGPNDRPRSLGRGGSAKATGHHSHSGRPPFRRKPSRV
jgi:DNA-directed RNA polymerase subunit RPC12/RpoP